MVVTDSFSNTFLTCPLSLTRTKNLSMKASSRLVVIVVFATRFTVAIHGTCVTADSCVCQCVNYKKILNPQVVLTFLMRRNASNSYNSIKKIEVETHVGCIICDTIPEIDQLGLGFQSSFVQLDVHEPITHTVRERYSTKSASSATIIPLLSLFHIIRLHRHGGNSC